MIYFLNSTNRVYDDNELNRMAGVLFSDGIFNTKSASHEAWLTAGDLLVEAPGLDMNITARAGIASLTVQSDGKPQQIFIQEDVALAATVTSNITLANRMDAVVLRVNQNTIDNDALNAAGDNAVSLVAISGNGATPLSDSAIAVAMAGDPFVRLADINVPFNATEIVSANVTDRRELVSMTRAVKAEFDSVRLFELQTDPDASQLKGGEIWYNQFDGILKFFDGTNISALQTQTYDWGYYPPDGIDDSANNFDVVSENEGEIGVSSLVAWKYYDFGGDDGTAMAGQLFVMPDMENPFIQVKMANPAYQADLVFETWTVDGAGAPVTEVQTPSVRSMPKATIPKNDYIDLFLDGSLYTAGVTYLLVMKAEGISQLNTNNDSDFKTGRVLFSNLDDDIFFKGYKTAFNSTTQTSIATSMTWNTTVSNRQWVMRISDRAQFRMNQTDATGNAHEVSQTFIAKSRDIIKFNVRKAPNTGSPTGDITASLYRADENGQSVGPVLTSAVKTEAELALVVDNENIEFDLTRDDLILGAKYVVVFDADVKDDTDNYRFFFAEYSRGQARVFNTVDGWVDLGGDFFYSTETTSSRKILVLGNNGLIPEKLINLENFRKIVPTAFRGTFTKNSSDASVQQVIPHGMPYAPTRVTLHGMLNSGSTVFSSSYGVWDVNGQHCVYSWQGGNSGNGAGANIIARFWVGNSSNEGQTGIMSVDETNIYIDWTENGSPNFHDMSFLWEAN